MISCEFLTTVTEGVVHSVHKVVIWSSFRCNMATQGELKYWTFCHCVTRSNQCVQLGQNVETWEAVPSLSETSNRGTYRLQCEKGIKIPNSVLVPSHSSSSDQPPVHPHDSCKV